MHHTLNTSLICFNVYSIRSNFYQNIKTTQKYFSWFFCIFTDVCSSVISFFCSTYCMKVCIFASTSRFDSKSRKCLPAYWLNPTSWLSANLGAKVPGEQVYASETKLMYTLSPQCFHSLRRWASMLLYNIYINFFRSCNFRPIGWASSESC